MADDNLYQELKTQLSDLKSFIEDPTIGPVIKSAIGPIRAVFPKIDELLDSLIKLMDDIETAISKVDITKIPGLSEVSTFTQKITDLLSNVLNLVPANVKDEITSVLGIAKTIGGLPQLGQQLIKDISDLLEAIKNDIKAIRNA
jgi:phage-related protein